MQQHSATTNASDNHIRIRRHSTWFSIHKCIIKSDNSVAGIQIIVNDFDENDDDDDDFS